MKNRITVIVLVALGSVFFGASAHSEVREIQKLSEIESFLMGDPLLIFDIDNTLLQPKGYLGSDEWYYFLLNRFQLNGMKGEDAQNKDDEIWNKTQGLIEVLPVEVETPVFIRKQQLRGIKMMALTARTSDIAERTLLQLRQVGIDFMEHSVFKGQLRVSREELRSKDAALFDKGILFVGEGNNKGKVLKHFLSKLSWIPKKIVFVDDKQKNVLNMESAWAESQVPHVSFRYGALDEKVKKYNQVMADLKDRKLRISFFLGS